MGETGCTRDEDEERTVRKDRKTVSDRTTDDRRGGGGVVPAYPPLPRAPLAAPGLQ